MSGVAARQRGIDLTRVRLFSIPIAVLIGLAGASALYHTISGSIADDQILNYDFLAARLVEHLMLSGISFAIVAVLFVPLGIAIAGAGFGGERGPARRRLRVKPGIFRNLRHNRRRVGIVAQSLGVGIPPV